MDIGSRLDKIREDKQISKNELARLSGLSRSGLTNVLDNIKSPSIDTLQKICDALGTPIVSIFAGRDIQNIHHSGLLSLFENANEQAQKSAFAVLKIGQNRGGYLSQTDVDVVEEFYNYAEQPGLIIPVVGKAAAGLPIEMIQEYDTSLEVSDTKIKPGDFAIIADGDSMIDAGISPGDRVIIRPQPTVEDGEIALVAVGDGSTIKRFYKVDDGIRLDPANNKYKAQKYSSIDSLRVIGKVIKVARSYKEHANNH